MEITEEIADRFMRFQEEMQLCVSERNIDQLRTLESEYFDYVASEAKKQNDYVPIYLMSLKEEADKLESSSMSFIMHAFMAMYLSAPEILESFCALILPGTVESLRTIDTEIKNRKLRTELGI